MKRSFNFADQKKANFYFKVLIKQKASYVFLAQIKVFDVERLNNPLDKDCKLPLNIFNEVLEKLSKFSKSRENNYFLLEDRRTVSNNGSLTK